MAGNGNLSGTPLSTNVGINSFMVSATDPGNLSNTATLNLTVLAAPPIWATGTNQPNGLQLNWSGGVGPYQMQWTTNLSNPNWQYVGLPMSVSNMLVPFTNDAAFYRISGQ